MKRFLTKRDSKLSLIPGNFFEELKALIMDAFGHETKLIATTTGQFNECDSVPYFKSASSNHNQRNIENLPKMKTATKS